MFVQPRDETAVVETGDNLGVVTSELGHSEFREEFVSGGPKYCAYKIVNTETGERKAVCKVRGITMNYNTSILVILEVIKDMILKRTERGHVIANTEKKIKRKRKAGEGVVSIIIEPSYKL